MKLSDYERALCSLAHRSSPWSGGETQFLARASLAEKLGLNALDGKLKGKADKDVSREPTFAVKLTPPEADLLIGLLTGGGQPMKPEYGVLMPPVIDKIRKNYPKK